MRHHATQYGSRDRARVNTAEAEGDVDHGHDDCSDVVGRPQRRTDQRRPESLDQVRERVPRKQDDLDPGAQIVERVEDRGEEDDDPENRVDEGLHVAEPGYGDPEPQADEQPVHRDQHHDRQRDENLRRERHEPRDEEDHVEHHVVGEVDELDPDVAQHQVAERLTDALQRGSTR